MANYHPADELLMQFAAGQLTNALGIQTACHLEFCKQCRHKARLYEQLGGDLIDSTTAVEVDRRAKEKLIEKLQQSIKVSDSKHSNNPVSKDSSYSDDFYINKILQGNPQLPKPLRRFITNNYEDLPWSGFSKSIKSFDLPFSDDHYTARFYKITAGQELPEHTHLGNEFTLVLSGSFSDLAGDYHAGDFVLADTSTHHQPKAHKEKDCICFAVMDAPLKMTGFFGRMLNPFIK